MSVSPLVSVCLRSALLASTLGLVSLLGCAGSSPYEKSYSADQRFFESEASEESMFGGNADVDVVALSSRSAPGRGAPRSNRARPAPAPPPPPRGDDGAPADATTAPQEPGNGDSDAAATKTPAKQKRHIIYTANYSLLVADATSSIEAFVKSVEDAGGYLSQRQNTSVTVRVPVAKFQTILDTLPLMGTIRHQQIQSQDVTAQMVDIQLRLDTALKSRARLTILLERAEKMEDILRIEAEVRRLTQEIEGMKGRLRQLSDQVSFSTISVTFQKDAPEIAPLNRQRRSRFAWIRRVGLERLLSDF